MEHITVLVLIGLAACVATFLVIWAIRARDSDVLGYGVMTIAVLALALSLELMLPTGSIEAGVSVDQTVAPSQPGPIKTQDKR